GHGFDAERDDVDLTATLRGWQQAGDVRLWKFIVSPENGARLDLATHTRALVAQMERDLDTPLEWAAIDHHNTGHPHVHLLVRGRDADGRPLEIAPTYIKTGLRTPGARGEDRHADVAGHAGDGARAPSGAARRGHHREPGTPPGASVRSSSACRRHHHRGGDPSDGAGRRDGARRRARRPALSA